MRKRELQNEREWRRLLGLDEDVCVGWVQHGVADQLLGHRDGLVHGHAQIRQVVQEPGKHNIDTYKQTNK